MPDVESPGVPVEEIKGYLEMQAHCGASGLIFTLAWFFFANHYKLINLFTFGNKWYLLGFILVLFALPVYPIGTIARSQIDEKKDNVARQLLRLCSIMCVIAFTLLMWFTGGAISPFVSLFVMTYTLTLSKVKTPRGPYVILSLFLISFLLASGLAKVNPLFSDDVLKQISFSDVTFYSLLVGGIGSLLIPAGSLIKIKHKKIGNV